MNRDARIYVAGHRGLVGSSILKKLEAEGYKNIITMPHTHLDLTRQAETEKFFLETRPEYVFLAAAKVGGIAANNTYRAQFIYENLAIACNVIHAAYRAGTVKLLNLGSSCIYPRNAPQPVKEEYLLTGPLEPTNEPYAMAKISAIKLCQFYHEQYGSEFISLMPSNLYGPDDNFDLETSHVLPAMTRKFHLTMLARDKNRQKIEEDEKKFGTIPDTFRKDLEMIIKGEKKPAVVLWGSGTPLREFLYSEDLADACIFIMKNFSRKQTGSFLNIGTGSDISISKLASMLRDEICPGIEITWDKSKPDGTPRKLLDISRVSRLGWKPEIDLETGIRMYYRWYLDQY